MAWREILLLTFDHEFYRPAQPPVSLRLEGDEGVFVLRRIGGHFVLLVDDEADERPEIARFILRAEAPEIFSVTEGANWNSRPEISAPVSEAEIRFSPREEAPAEEPSALLDPDLLLLEVALPETGMRQLTLGFSTVSALQAFYLIGGDPEQHLEILDSAASISFDDLGEQMLPDRRPARLFRSRTPIPASERQKMRFSLYGEGDHGRMLIVPALPAGGARFRSAVPPASPGELQSDIYVNL